MATQTLGAADAILKDLYVGPIVEMLNNKTYMLDQIQRDVSSIDHTGRRAIIPLHTNRNRGRGSIAESGTLPTAGVQSYADAIVSIRYHTYGIQISDQAIEATKRSEGAFLNLLDAETKGVARDMKKDINRQVYGVGTGLLGNVTSAADAASKTTLTMTNKVDLQYIQVGDIVDVVVQSTGATSFGGLGLVVESRSVSAKTVTFTTTVATAASIDTTFGVYVKGSRNNEMDGLRNIVSSGRTLHSINSSTAGNEYWNSTVTNVGSSATATSVVGESSFEKLLDDVGANGNGEIDTFVTTRGIRRRLADQYQSQKRFNDAQAVKVHGGFSAIMVNEMPVIFDDDCPKTEVFGINKDSFRWFEQAGPAWLESKDGTVFQLQPASTGTSATYNSVWLAWFKWYVALGCLAPNRNGRLKFCTDDDPA
jgi:hypothetical protein